MRDIARTAGLGREEGQANRLLANALDKLDAPEAETWSKNENKSSLFLG